MALNRHKHGKPSAHQIPKRRYKLDMIGLKGVTYIGNQNVPGFIYHATKGWRRA